jgi:hypothetical protein
MFSPAALALVVAGGACAFAARFWTPGPPSRLAWAAAATFSATGVLYILGPLCLLPAALAWLAIVWVERKGWWIPLGALVALQMFLLEQLWHWGRASIDLFGCLQMAGHRLAALANPYAGTCPVYIDGSMDHVAHFMYGPAIALVATPFALIGDVRSGMALLLLGVYAGAILWTRSAPQPYSRYVATLVAASPFTLGLIVSAWVDALPMCAFVGWLLLKDRYRALALALLAVCFASKPLPALALLPGLPWSRRWLVDTIAAAAIAAAIALPFAIATGLPTFVNDVAGVFVSLFPPRADGITVTALLLRLGGQALPDWLAAAGVLAAGAAMAVRRPRSLADVLVGGAFITVVGFLLSRQAFFNYYFVSATLLMYALVAAGRPLSAIEAPPEGSMTAQAPVARAAGT